MCDLHSYPHKYLSDTHPQRHILRWAYVKTHLYILFGNYLATGFLPRSIYPCSNFLSRLLELVHLVMATLDRPKSHHTYWILMCHYWVSLCDLYLCYNEFWSVKRRYADEWSSLRNIPIPRLNVHSPDALVQVYLFCTFDSHFYGESSDVVLLPLSCHDLHLSSLGQYWWKVCLLSSISSMCSKSFKVSSYSSSSPVRRQARRTGTSSPLGELFDHACDSLYATLAVVPTIYCIGAPSLLMVCHL